MLNEVVKSVTLDSSNNYGEKHDIFSASEFDLHAIVTYYGNSTTETIDVTPTLEGNHIVYSNAALTDS